MPKKKELGGESATTETAAKAAAVKKARSSKARAARDKGRRGELRVAKKLRQLWVKVERLAQDRGRHTEGPDIQVMEALLDVEVRHREQSSIPSAIKAATNNCRPGHTWAAVDWPTGTGHRKQITITFDLDQWIDFTLAERERAERAGFEAGQLHTAVTAGAKPPLAPPTSSGPVRVGSLKDLQP